MHKTVKTAYIYKKYPTRILRFASDNLYVPHIGITFFLFAQICVFCQYLKPSLKSDGFVFICI